MADNVLKLKKYINKYNVCTCENKKNIYKQKINKYYQLGGAEVSWLNVLPGERLVGLGELSEVDINWFLYLCSRLIYVLS